MRRIGVEEAAAIGAEHLDRDLGGDRADRDGLLGTLERGGLDIVTERLRDALPDQEQRIDNTDWQQHIEAAAGDVDPKISDGARRRAREAADQGDRQRDAGCRRQEVLVRQAEHLHEIGQRALSTVILPVGVGDEGDRGVEGEIRGDSALAGRIERQDGLQPHHAVDDEEAADMEQQHGDRIGQPMLLALLVDAGEPVDAGLDRTQHRRQEGPLAVEHARHVPAERFCERDGNDAKENDLEPTDHSHDINPSGFVSTVRTARAAAARK
ncbi:hypothetical protein ACVWZK_003214 [Bradyrhizobium sp. GM0.4]